MTKELKVLDRIEGIRQKANDNPVNYPTDYAIRLCEAIIAEYFDYKGRNQWTDELKKYPDSNYSAMLKNKNIVCK